MEHNFHNNSFERLLRTQTEDFKMQPSRKVWQGIYNDVHPSRKLPSIVMSLVLITSLLLLGYLNTSEGRKARALLASTKLPSSGSNNPGSNTDARTSTDAVQPGLSSVTNTTAPAVRQQDVLPGIPVQANQPRLIPGTASNNAYSNRNNSHPAGRNTSPVQNNAALSGNSRSNNQLMAAAPQDIPVAGQIIHAPTRNTAATTAITGTENNVTIAAETNNIIELPRQQTKATTSPEKENGTTQLTTAGQNESSNSTNTPSVSSSKSFVTAPTKLMAAANRMQPSKEDKAWMEDDAMHNRTRRNKWKGRLDWQVYAATGFTYRTLVNKSEYELNNTSTPISRVNMNGSVTHKPGLHLETGAALLYAVSKNLRIKTGLQFDYTNYFIYAYESTHPISTSLTLLDVNTGNPVTHSRSTTFFNNGAGDLVLNSSTYQISIPVGFDLKLAGTDRLKWYAGATIQPTLMLGGKNYLLSSDHQNYIAENSLQRKFNMNAGIETFASYKTGNYTLQLGPYVRYQLLSTNSKRYVNTEKLFGYGLRVGLVKSF